MERPQRIRKFRAMLGFLKKNKEEDYVDEQELSDEARKYASDSADDREDNSGDEGGQSASAGKQHKGAEGNDYRAMKEKWNRERTEIAKANLVRMFDTDDDLPFSKHLLLITIFGFFMGALGWSMIGKLDEIARGQGEVVPASAVQVVQTIEAGIVKQILVQEGQEVEQGQVLIELSNIEASSDLQANLTKIFGLKASIARLKAEAEGKSSVDFPDEVMSGSPKSVTEELNTFRANQDLIFSQTNVLEQQIASRNQEVRGLEIAVGDARAVLQSQKDEKALVKPLVDRGTAPQMELLQLDRAIKQAEADLNRQQSSLRQARASVGEVRARIREVKRSAQARASTELVAKQNEVNELEERIGALEDRQSRKNLVAPVSGKIQEIAVKSIDAVVSPGEDIVKIIPRDDQLIVEAKISPSDRAFVNEGDKAIIKITAYDFSIYGSLKAELTEISPDTITDEQGNTFYRVRLKSGENKLYRNGEQYDIKVGMQASVDILTGQKTVLQYLLKPFIKTLDIAFTER